MVKYRKSAQQPQVYRTRYHVFQLYQLEYVICVYRFALHENLSLIGIHWKDSLRFFCEVKAKQCSISTVFL